MRLLQQGETLTASTEVQAIAEQVYAVISDVTRIPQWSPETKRAERIDADHFRAWNRRRLGRWQTRAKIVDADPGHRFSFVVQAFGGDWTEWTYLMEPGSHPGSTRLTESFRMCVGFPVTAVVFEHLFLLVHDRRADLQTNLQVSVDRIRAIVEGHATC